MIGPALGGYMAELYSWRWAFYGLVPVGVISCIGLRLSMLRDPPRHPVKLDWIGFLSLVGGDFVRAARAVARPAARLVRIAGDLARDDRRRARLYIFVAHSLTAERPFLNPRLLLDRNYALGLLLVGVFGMLNVTPMVLLPPLLKQYAGFPDGLIGEVLAARGAGATIGFFAAMFLGKLDPRIGMGLGFGLQVISGLWLMSIDLNVTMDILMANSMLQGMAIGVIWVPLTIASFATLENRFWAEAMAVFHLLRNIGSSFFISLCVADIIA